jgi:hypothetical protein
MARPEIEAAVDRLIEQERAAGLPDTITNPEVLAELSRIIDGSPYRSRVVERRGQRRRRAPPANEKKAQK